MQGRAKTGLGAFHRQFYASPHFFLYNRHDCIHPYPMENSSGGISITRVFPKTPCKLPQQFIRTVIDPLLYHGVMPNEHCPIFLSKNSESEELVLLLHTILR